MTSVKIKPEGEPLRKVYVESSSFYNRHLPPLELYIPVTNQLELPTGVSYTVTNGSLYCDTVPKTIGLPRSMGIEIKALIPV